jgi:acetylornithine deacetylase/succinyl-diaminopimelate desuccinylase-like protein
MQRHKPDEYITVEQMRRCDRMLETLQTHLIEGIS